MNANRVFVSHDGMKVHFPLAVLKDDGVHFNEAGTHRLYQSVGGAIRYAI